VSNHRHRNTKAVGDHWSDEEANALAWRAASEIGLDVERLTLADLAAMAEAE
jgi:hypothetical protein